MSSSQLTIQNPIVLGITGQKAVISAYDIAVKNGFVGAESEWLQTLKFIQSPITGEVLAAAQAAAASALDAGASEQVATQKAAQTVEDAASALASKVDAESAALSIQSSIQNLGNIVGSVGINLTLGTLILATLTGTVTLSFTGLPIASRETAFSLRFTNVQSITFPLGTKFAGGASPSIIGPRFELPCTINSVGNIIVYGSINNI
jgi:hypothetical protein